MLGVSWTLSQCQHNLSEFCSVRNRQTAQHSPTTVRLCQLRTADADDDCRGLCSGSWDCRGTCRLPQDADLLLNMGDGLRDSLRRDPRDALKIEMAFWLARGMPIMLPPKSLGNWALWMLFTRPESATQTNYGFPFGIAGHVT